MTAIETMPADLATLVCFVAGAFSVGSARSSGDSAEGWLEISGICELKNVDYLTKQKSRINRGFASGYELDR
jgi:hypothetical protein